MSVQMYASAFVAHMICDAEDLKKTFDALSEEQLEELIEDSRTFTAAARSVLKARRRGRRGT